MEEQKYFTPEIEDICSGYEYEVNDGGKWIKIKEFSNAYLYDDNSHYEVMKDIDAGRIRVSYLTKEQIENEGWQFIPNTSFLYFEKSNKDITYNPDYNRLIICKFGEQIFKGTCKDINTFRYICKLLEI